MEAVLTYDGTYLEDYIKTEIIKNPEILDCLIDYGYEEDKEWIKKFDSNIFEKIETYNQIKRLNEVTIEYEVKKGRKRREKEKQEINKNEQKKTNRTATKNKRRNTKRVNPFPSKSNQEKNIERVKQLRNRREH